MSVPARRLCRLVFLFLAALLLSSTSFAQSPTPGQNVNMVSGTSLPGGDPFLQRQNEPSVAVSTRNPLHLLAGANDYRSVNIPFVDPVPGSLAGDAWLGVFKSFDGGQTWQSTLLPGYPQDNSALGLASPLRGHEAAADPTVRPGTNGLFYYSGIAFNRTSNLGVVFVARFIDLNNKENGDVAGGTDPIRYIDTTVVDSGTSGQFLDKPWVVADIPRPGAGTCTINAGGSTQTFPAGNVYSVWSRFTGSNSTKIMISRSTDCGATWAMPQKLSESNSLNQGTNLAIDPVTGDLYVTWRRFATKSQPDAILFAKSSDFGKTFTKAKEIATIVPFDQGTTPGSFRTNALPTSVISVDGLNASRIHVAWADRGTPGGDARIVMSTSSDGGKTWTSPAIVDPGPVQDDFSNTFTRGHQFMPQLTFTAGKLMLLYYDSRLDHTIGFYHPNSEPRPDLDPPCFFFCPDESGRFYKEQRSPWGEFGAFSSFVTDAGLAMKRRTLELHVAQTDAGPFASFQYARVSQYIFGLLNDGSSTLQQLKVNPPNLPMFAGGTMPFIGDYIDIAGLMFLPPETPGGNWRYNIGSDSSAVAYAAWTSNEDVRPPADGNWANFTPPGDPNCVPGQVGIRNQNIYSSRITQGLLVSSPQNSKPLSTDLQRAFVILVHNQTSTARAFRMTIANQPPPGIYPTGYASFLQGSLSTTLEVMVPAHSAVARSVYAKSTEPAARIVVNVEEINVPGGGPGLSSFVLLNGDPTVPILVDPDGYDGESISVVEVYNPNISNPNISNPNISNPNISNPNISNPNVANPNISNPNISNLEIADPNISNPNISNPNIANPNISNPNIANPNISNTALTDVTYELKNEGNTSASYTVNLIGNLPPTVSNVQLIVNKPYLTPTFSLENACQLSVQSQNILLTNVNAPVFSNLSDYTNPNIANPNISNATFMLAPGETALVTMRATLNTEESGGSTFATQSVQDALEELSQTAAPVVVSQAVNTDGSTNPFAAPLLIVTSSLDSGRVGQAYSETVMAVGGTPDYSWSIASGSLPSGLSLDAATGEISGTPAETGTFTFTVQVTDATTPTARTNTRSLRITILKGDTVLTIVSDEPDSSVTGQSITVQFTLEPSSPVAPAGSVTITDGVDSCVAVLPAANCQLTLTKAGMKTLTATYPGDDNFNGSSDTETHLVEKASTTTTILSNAPNPSVVGETVTVTWQVTVVPPGSGTPTGNVTVSDGQGLECSAPLAAGNCTLTFLTVGTRTLTASYAGDDDFKSSVSAGVEQQVHFVFVGFLSPLAPSGTFQSPSFSGDGPLGTAFPLKWQLKDAQGSLIDDLGSLVRMEAWLNTDCAGAPESKVIDLYSPTNGATGSSTFRYGNSQFIFNWDTTSVTSTGKGCYTVVMELSDGGVRATTVQLR